MTMQRILISIALVTAAAACGKKEEDKGGGGGGGAAAKKEGGGGGGGSKLSGGCDRREKEGLCEEYWSSQAKPDWIKQQCDARGVAFVDACPKDGALARCIANPGTPSEMQLLFYAPLTNDTAKVMCDGLSGKLGTP